ncbi:MAG TPA: DUF6036 family nucleotidyltransferase [Polyangiaceae bacterium]|nr:DUF6036 family nucleotidyltransferase [Polyangiaceae bacterium]
MTREQLEHVIRAAATISNDDEIVVVGSQSILGRYPTAPSELLVSNEADVYPKNHPELADLIDGSIGELSPFHDTFGYYAQGVGPETAVLPVSWQSRVVEIRTPATRGAVGLCLEPHDLLISKYVAGREKDRRFAKDALRYGLVSPGTLRERLAETSVDDATRSRVAAAIAADAEGSA